MNRSAGLVDRGRLCLAVVLLAAASGAARAQSAENVAIVINEDSAVSQRIGEYYALQRALPAANVIRIRSVAQESIDRTAYLSTIEEPIAAAIGRQSLQDRVLYLVLTKGVPLRIEGTDGSNGTAASVDSELTLLYRRMTGQAVPTLGRVDNPYFLRGAPPSEARPFTHREHDILLVTRLDGFTEQDVLALIDRGLSPSTAGQVVLDGRDPLVNRNEEAWLETAARRLGEQGHSGRVLHDATPNPVRTGEPVLGYYSWGALDPQNRTRQTGLRFVPGALAASFSPADARTFQPPADGWLPTAASLSDEESTHGLLGDLIRDGVTGVAGQVAERYMQSMVRPEVLFPAYLGGANLAEAFYQAIPYLSGQTVVIGDPLCAPFRKTVLSRGQIEDPLDRVTELPGLFARHQIARVIALNPGISEEAAAQRARAGSLLARGDTAGGREALERASDLAPRVILWQLELASMYEAANQYDAAIVRYRRVLETNPNSVVTLNNLAYALAVRKKLPGDAHPLAKRAANLAPGQPLILDTLGWIEHLLGNSAEAAKLLAQAVRGAPENAELRLHAAIVYAAVGDRQGAEAELAEVLRLDPALKTRDEVRQLQETFESSERSLPVLPQRNQ